MIKKKLALAMIVRDESKVIKRCLDSVKNIIDYYIIIEDSRSTDNTIDIIRETLKDIPGKIIRKDWAGFADTRNYYINVAKGKADYILVMDADQILQVDNDFDKNKLTENVYYCTIKYKTFQHYFEKIFKPDCGCKYRGILHEYIEYKNPRGTLNNIRFLDLHDGARGNDNNKSAKDIKVLKEAITKDPQLQARYTFYLAQTLRENGNYKESIEYYQKRINLGGWEEEIYTSLYQIGRCYEHMKQPKIAIDSYLKAYNYRPTRAESLYRLAILYRESDQRQLAYTFSKLGIQVKYPKDILFVDYPVYNYLMLFEYSIALYWVGKYKEAIEAGNKLDLIARVPEYIKKQNKKNLKFSLTKFRTPKKYDIIFYDEVGFPFTSSTYKNAGMGGSELEASFLLNKLSETKKILACSATKELKIENGIEWKNYNDCYGDECDTLILFRYSQIPPIKYKKLIVWAHDAGSFYYRHLFEPLKNDNSTLVVISDWHKSLFEGKAKNIVKIENAVPEWVFDYKTKKDKNKYIYASANLKGLETTVKYWLELKKQTSFKKAKLYVCTPGYEKVNEDILKKANIIFLGCLKLREVVKEIASSIGMFYVNDVPETFGISPYLAEILKCRTHILCTHGFGALKEVLNSDLLTDNKDKFMKDVLETYKKGGYLANPKRFTIGKQYTKFKKIINEKIKHNIINIKGMKFKVRKNRFDETILSEEINMPIYQIPKNLKTVIDIGAHIGGTSILCATKGATVYSYEPEKENFKLLLENTKLNRVENQVHCFKKAVGKIGKRKLYLTSNNSGMGSLYRKKGEFEEVETVTIQEVFKNISHCDLLKIDCEGAEYEFIKDIPFEKVDQISMELHIYKEKQKELIQYLKQYYKVNQKPSLDGRAIMLFAYKKLKDK